MHVMTYIIDSQKMGIVRDFLIRLKYAPNVKKYTETLLSVIDGQILKR